MPPGPRKFGSGYGFSRAAPFFDQRDAGTIRFGKATPVLGSTGAGRDEPLKSPERSAATLIVAEPKFVLKFRAAVTLLALAETYDPAVLSAWGTVGTQGDVAKARQLYGRASAGGVHEAKYRLSALR